MVAESIPIYSLVKGLIRYVPSFLLKRHFTEEKLANLVYCDLVPRGESAQINVGLVANANVFLQLINLSPFPLEIDKAKLKMNCAGGVIDFIHLGRQTLEPGIVMNLPLQEGIHEGSANVIANSSEVRIKADLSGLIEFKCSIRYFTKKISLSDIRPVVINANARKST